MPAGTPVPAALPAGADVVSRYDAGAVWWQDPRVAITFRTTTDAGTVVAHADAALTSLGWAPAPDLRDTVWSKVAGSAAGGGSARLSRSGAGGADQSWTLTASAAVPGPHRTASC